MDNIFVTILDLFSPAIIYEQLDGVIAIYSRVIIPIVIIFSIAVRYLEVQAENIGQGGKLSEAIKDIKLSLIFTALYTAFGATVITFHQALCGLMYSHGSLSTLLSNYQEFMESLKAVDENAGALEKLKNKMNTYSIEAIITQALLFVSMLLLAGVNVLLRIIYAIGFCMIYVWGMVAVPSMSTKLLNVASGWFRGAMALFLWPLIEAFIYILLNPLFDGLSEKIVDMTTYTTGGQIAGVSLIYTFANILLMTAGVSAFFVSVTISMNQNMLGGLGTSMVATWAASTSLVMSGARLFKGAARQGMSLMSGGGGGGGGAENGGPTSSLDGISSGGGHGGPSASNNSTGGNMHSEQASGQESSVGGGVGNQNQQHGGNDIGANNESLAQRDISEQASGQSQKSNDASVMNELKTT